MCNFKSYVVTSDLKVHGSHQTGSHEKIIESIGLKPLVDQDAILTRDRVCVEVTQKNKSKMTRNVRDWVYCEDETASLPEWYKKNKGRIEETVFQQLMEDLKIQLVLNDEIREVTNVELYCFDSSTVISYGSSKVISYDSSTVESYDSSTVISYDSSKVVSHDSSTVELKSKYAFALSSSGKIIVNSNAVVVVKDGACKNCEV